MTLLLYFNLKYKLQQWNELWKKALQLQKNGDNDNDKQ